MRKIKICPMCKKIFNHTENKFCSKDCYCKFSSMSRKIPVDEEYLINHIKVNKKTNCWNWIGFKDKDGYGKIRQGRFEKEQRAHRISYIIFKEDFDRSLIVCHKCDNPSCINPDHLFIGTHSINHRDMQSKNRSNYAIGERHGRSILKKEDVLTIKKMRHDNISVKKISKKFGISISYIYELLRNEKWSHLEEG